METKISCKEHGIRNSVLSIYHIAKTLRKEGKIDDQDFMQIKVYLERMEEACNMDFLPIVELIRLEENEDYGTFGILKINKVLFCCTLEPGDFENEPRKGSIPAQQYLCRRYMSSRHGETFIVHNVPDRTGILFHAGNTIADTIGCIVLGQYFDKLRGDRAVLNSGNTFRAFLDYMTGYDSFHLTIAELY